MNILITICARGGSKGIPKKNIKLLNGQPLIYYTIKTAVNFAKLADFEVDIALSTDSIEIKETVISSNFSIDTSHKRPKKLSTDSAGKIQVIRELKDFMENKNQKKYDFILDLDVTSPLRTIGDLKDSFKELLSSKKALNMFSVSIANRNPYFNMVEKNKEGFYQLCKQGNSVSRQKSPIVYELNASFYWYKSVFFDLQYLSAITDRSLIFPLKHVCFDLDHPIDFDFMEYLMSNDKLDFQLYQ